jgi:hypothetical protein
MRSREREIRPAGYSGTPLLKKLGLSEGRTLFPVGAPRHYKELLGPLPAGARFVARAAPGTDIVHLFTTERRQLAERLRSLYATIEPDAAVWVSWPKKTARVPTDITEDVIREVALPLGFVDVKVCAVDEVWSGLKLVIRKAKRATR